MNRAVKKGFELHYLSMLIAFCCFAVSKFFVKCGYCFVVTAGLLLLVMLTGLFCAVHGADSTGRTESGEVSTHLC